MSSRPLLGEGREADEATRLRREIAGLEQELQEARDEATKAKQAAADSVQAIRALRQQLEPLHKTLKMLFGEISRVDVGTVASPTAANGNRDPRWDSWKSKLPEKAGEFIELLLLHREMTSGQLAAAAKCDPRTVTRAIFALNKAQLITKNGGRFSLREL